MKNKPLFIIGNPRSGTSLFRLMLTSHSLICVPPECGFIQWWNSKYNSWSIKDSKNFDSIKNFVHDLSKSKKIETWDLDYSNLESRIYNEMPLNYSDLCMSVIREFAYEQLKASVKFLGDKNNYYISLENLELINKLYPDAIFLIIVRDGRDVACSYKNLKKIKSESKYKPKLSTDIEVISREWSENNLNALRFMKKNANERYTVLKFEDLILDPKEELQRISNFLQIPYEDAMLSYNSKNKTSELEPKELMDWKQKTYEAPDRSNIFKYKNELELGEIEIFNRIAENALKEFGYEI